MKKQMTIIVQYCRHSMAIIWDEVAPVTLRMPISLRRYWVSNIIRQKTPTSVMMMPMHENRYTSWVKRNSLA